MTLLSAPLIVLDVESSGIFGKHPFARVVDAPPGGRLGRHALDAVADVAGWALDDARLLPGDQAMIPTLLLTLLRRYRLTREGRRLVVIRVRRHYADP